MRMLKRYPLVQAGNTKPAMTTFSDAIVLRDGDATEAIGRFVGDINDHAHASIWQINENLITTCTKCNNVMQHHTIYNYS